MVDLLLPHGYFNICLSELDTLACLLQMDPPRFDKVCQYCERVLEEQPSNPKAMYRNAVALYNLRDVESALLLLKKLFAANHRG